MYHYSPERMLVQLLAEAVQHERSCERSYQIMASSAPTSDEQRQISLLRRDERRHLVVLVGIYEEMTGIWDEGYATSSSLPADYPEMLKTAVCDKLSGAALYEQIIAALVCPRQKELICQIMNDEKHHARILAALYQQNHRPRSSFRETPQWWEPGFRPYKY